MYVFRDDHASALFHTAQDPFCHGDGIGPLSLGNSKGYGRIDPLR